MLQSLPLPRKETYIPWWLKDCTCNNSQESENEKNSDFWKEKQFTTKLVRLSKKSCLIWFLSIAQLRNISCLKWAEIVLLKSSIVWKTSLITRYLVTILLTIKIKVRRWYWRLLWPFFALTVCQEFYFSQILILWVQSVVRALSQAPSMCHITLSYMVTYEMNVSEVLTKSKLIDSLSKD